MKRRCRAGSSLLTAAFLVTSSFAWAGGAVIGPNNEMSRGVDYSDIISGLVEKLSGTRSEAMDASVKLGQMGRRAVPALATVVKTSKNQQALFFAVRSLTLIRHPSAAKSLLPILKDKEADRNLRIMAIGAVGADDLADSVDELKKLAIDPNDGDMRFVALKALSVMKTAWNDSEELFVKGLSDDRDDIRTLCTKVCYQVATLRIFYYSAEPRLLEIAEKGHVVGVRCNSMAALARMKSRLAVPMLVRLLGNEDTPSSVSKYALKAFQALTGVPVRDVAAVEKWWEQFGKKRYANAAPLRPAVPKAKDGEKDGSPPSRTAQPRKSIPDDNKSGRTPYRGVTMGGE